MISMLSSLFGASKSMKAPVNRKASIGLEALEDRMMPTVQLVGGHLLIYGDVQKIPYSYYPADANDNVQVNLVNGYYRVTQNGRVSSFAASSVTGQILFKGGGGDDVFYNNTALTCYAYGEAGNDRLYGGSGTDYLYGGANNDILYGGTGVDYLYGEDGNDTLYAGYDYSYNYLDGGSGDDFLYGGWGGERLVGRAGNDVIYGDAGNDHISGGDGNDRLYGGAGNDTLRGENGNDYLYGEDGNDYLDGGLGIDVLQGGYGDDTLYGGDDGTRNGDKLFGGAGRDTFIHAIDYDPTTDYWFDPYYPPSFDESMDWTPEDISVDAGEQLRAEGRG